MENKVANGGDKKSEAAKSEFQNSETPIPEKVNTTVQLADSVGISTDTMNRVIQIDKNAPPTIIEALDNASLL
jgi:hypothetical protein